MIELVTALLLLLSPLHLEADATRAELVRGDTFTIDAYLFNDGLTPTRATFDIVGPPGFELIDAPQEGDVREIAPGGAAHARFRYRVLDVASKGLARFVVSGGGQTSVVTIRVGPSPQRVVWVAMARG